jgi:hypothetical protein
VLPPNSTHVPQYVAAAAGALTGAALLVSQGSTSHHAAPAGELGCSASKKDLHMAAVDRNFVLFKTDLFVCRQRDEDIDKWFVGGDCAGWYYVRLLLVDHIQKDLDPVMEDWGWTFALSVDGVIVRINVWTYLIDNCWLFGLESKGGWFRRPSSEKMIAAKEVVANALDATMAADSRIVKHAWFADNPFELNLKDF